MNHPKAGQVGFWKDREKAVKHAKTKLCRAGGSVSGAKNLQKARESFQRKYGVPVTLAWKGREWLEDHAKQVQQRQQLEEQRPDWWASVVMVLLLWGQSITFNTLTVLLFEGSVGGWPGKPEFVLLERSIT